MQSVRIENTARKSETEITLILCQNYFSRLIGLMFRKKLGKDQGILIDQGRDSILGSSIHMFFMNFDLTVVWVDTTQVVRDVVRAKRWRPAYLPKAPARYVLECHADLIDSFSQGDQLIFHYE